jgi:hypothetical protein
VEALAVVRPRLVGEALQELPFGRADAECLATEPTGNRELHSYPDAEPPLGRGNRAPQRRPGGFVDLKEMAAYAQSEPTRDFRIAPSDESNMTKYLFDGFKRCLYPVQKFQGDTKCPRYHPGPGL